MGHSVGISFSEVMKGGFALGQTDPKDGKKAGERSGNELAIHADVLIDDIEGFVKDPNHLGSLSGSIDFTPFGTALQGTTGVFNLFNPTDNPKLKLMVYELGFEHGGKSYYFAGKKEVRDDFGLDLWSDTTTLYSQLHEGPDKSGPVVGAGTLTLGVSDLISLIRTVDTPGSQSKTEAAAAITKFGKFFLAELWDTYVIHCKKV